MALTLGMATYDDFHGVYMTVQSARMYHGKTFSQIVIVDNNPKSAHGKMTKDLAGWWPGIKYVPFEESQGTSQTRNKVIEAADFDYVLVCDPHVMFPQGSPEAGYDFIRMNRDDLVQGPMLMDNLVQMSTHFDFDTRFDKNTGIELIPPGWRDEMWGIWGGDSEKLNTGRPFEVPGQGLGAFMVRKASWLGFNKEFRSFGGEEGYIHIKYRQAGRKTWCVPKFKWLHRFGRPDGTPYKASLHDKIRNYVLGHLELGMDPEPIRIHFMDHKKKITAKDWEFLGKGELPPEGCNTCGDKLLDWTVDQWYAAAAAKPSDINEHVPTLKELATGCDTVVEFGVRTGNSTAGLAAGKPKMLLTFDFAPNRNSELIAKAVEREGRGMIFTVVPNSTDLTIPECDLLFLDTHHHGPALLAELNKHAPMVKGRIAFHDSHIFGEKGEGGQPGLLAGLRAFLAQNPEWSTIRQDMNNHGFTVISRIKEEIPKLPSFLRMAMNYTKAQIKDLANGKTRVPLEVAEARYAVCTSNAGRCPVKLRQIDSDRCTGCGCWLQEKPDQGPQSGKVWYPLDACPVGLWGNWKSDDEAKGWLPISQAVAE